MYYNRILRVWVVDPLDYFLLSAILGSILASCLKDYLSEEKSMERLKNSMIKKSKLLIKSDKPTFTPNSKKIRITKIYRLALRGGQFEEDFEFPNEEAFMFAQKIRGLVERLAKFLKQQELKGVARIFFKSGRLFLELILFKCKINITYSLLAQQVSTQVVIITATAGGTAGFVISWFSAGATLVSVPILISILFIRSFAQQIVNQKNYLKFKKLVIKILEDDDLKQTLRAYFLDGEAPLPAGIEMKTWNSDKNFLPELDFDSDQTFEEFIKERMKEQLGLIQDPTPEQITEIVNNRKKGKGKTVHFRDFVKAISENTDHITDDIIDAEIVKEAIKVKVENDEF